MRVRRELYEKMRLRRKDEQRSDEESIKFAKSSLPFGNIFVTGNIEGTDDVKKLRVTKIGPRIGFFNLQERQMNEQSL